MGGRQGVEIHFSEQDKSYYRSFADSVRKHITKIERGAKYFDDIEKIQQNLEAAYRNCMLEKDVPTSYQILSCLLSGGYFYKKEGFGVPALRGFVYLLKSANHEKRRIIIANLHTSLDAIERYSEPDEFDKDIPF